MKGSGSPRALSADAEGHSLQNEALAARPEASRTAAVPTPSVLEPSGASEELPGRE